MSSYSPSLAYSNDDIDPAILADVTRVVQELMKMQQLEQAQQKEQHQLQCGNHNHNDVDKISSVSREFHDQDSIAYEDDAAERMDVDIEVDVSLLSVQEENQNTTQQGDDSRDQSSLLFSASTFSSIASPSGSTPSSASCITTPQSSLQASMSNNGSGSDQVLINSLSGQNISSCSAKDLSDKPNESVDKNNNKSTATVAASSAIESAQNTSDLSATSIIPRPSLQPPTRPRRRKALLIGINYFGDPNQLLGCINDTKDVFGFLNGYFGFRYQDTIMLTDDNVYEDKRPTGANIRYWMKWLVKDAEPQDSLFFHYAGHGGRIKDFSYNGKAEHLGDEADGYDEIIYPCDYLRSGIISDDEMYDLMVKELPAGVQLTALVDACHSGTMLDLPYVYNGNHVTALEKVTRTKVGAMAAMSASDVVFDMPGSNNNVQTITTTTTTTTVTTRNADGTDSIVTQITNGTAMTKEGHLSPPGGLPPIHPKEGGSPLLIPGQTHSKRSISAVEDDEESDNSIPTLKISECSSDDDSGSERLKPSPRKRSRSVNNAITQPDIGVEGVLTSVDDLRGIDCGIAPSNVEEVADVKMDVEMSSVVIQSMSDEKSNEVEDDNDDEGMEEARRMAMFRKTKGNVVMFSGCRDDQASADIRASAKDAAIISNHHKSLTGGTTTSWSSPSMENDCSNPLGYSLPQPYSSPLARGAVSYAWIQCLSQKPNQTYEELLISMRHFMKQRDLEQVPQLGSGMPMDMRTVFTL